MGEIWIKEAEDLTAAGTSGVMEGGSPRATWHVTVSPSGHSAGGTQYFDVMHRVLTSKRSEPHILYDPVTDRLGQYFPLNRSARALGNDGTRRTNGEGTVNIQIEVVANTTPVFTKYWKPGPNFRALMRAIRSWGIPDEWPSGRLATSYADNVNRSWTSYRKPGHFAHCQVPGNDHWDTGPIDQQALFLREDDDMQLSDLVTVTQTDGTGTEEVPLATLFNRLHFVYAEVLRQRTTQATQTAAIKALAEAVAALPQGASAQDIAAQIIAQLLAEGVTVLENLKPYAKAFAGGLVSAIAFAVPVVDNGLTPSEILGIAGAFLVGLGVVYQVPNRGYGSGV